jgi:CDP-diacylglycerol--glycerol-3-phosphate 3-phosphatidyltransferase
MRILLVPVLLVVLVARFPIPSWATQVIAAVIFFAASITDLFDGKIARRNNLITDFGKFMDPLADKFLVFAALLGILFRFDGSEAGFGDLRPVFIWASAIVIFRELAVTSLRLVIAGKDGIVIAASMLGKIKTTTQMICISTILLEPCLFKWFKPFGEWHILSYVTIGLMTVMTLWSGIDYIAHYWKYIDPNN